jgi:lipopolysaccharide transport system ATP-binding protein
MSIIKVENLGKKYIISHQKTESYTVLRDVIANAVKDFGRRSVRRLISFGKRSDVKHAASNTEDFWALKDVSFELEQGDRLGIIGRNGAGKSTILKVLSRITEPTKGRISIRGKVASLLEVGTGFHPELTGRENIYLNGAILGMTRSEIRRKFDEIVAFAEVEKFLDIPVKRYSSGMYVRLAFAVAANIDPDVLIVDEVLAVGDAKFQKKCLGKMEEVSRQAGRSVIFVSHDMGAINSLCHTCIALEKGKILFNGYTQQAISTYLGSAKETMSVGVMEWQAELNRKYAFDELIRIRRLFICDDNGNQYSSILYNSKEYRATVEIELVKPDPNIILALAYYSLNGSLLFVNNLTDDKAIKLDELKPGRYLLASPVPVELFANGGGHLEVLCVIHTAGWVLPKDNESRIMLEYFRDINPTTEIALGLQQPLMPVFHWAVQPL